LVRAPSSHGGSRRFESFAAHYRKPSRTKNLDTCQGNASSNPSVQRFAQEQTHTKEGTEDDSEGYGPSRDGKRQDVSVIDEDVVRSAIAACCSGERFQGKNWLNVVGGLAVRRRTTLQVTHKPQPRIDFSSAPALPTVKTSSPLASQRSMRFQIGTASR
jgi:hypothetical protein